MSAPAILDQRASQYAQPYNYGVYAASRPSNYSEGRFVLLQQQMLEVESSAEIESLDLRKTAFKASRLAESLQQEVIKKNARINSQSQLITHLETSLEDALREKQALIEQVHGQSDLIDLQSSQNSDLILRLEQNQARCAQIEAQIVQARTELEDRKELAVLKEEGRIIHEGEERKITIIAGKTCVLTFILCLICPPFISIPLGGTYTALSLNDSEWKVLEARIKVIREEIKLIKARLPEFQPTHEVNPENPD